MKAVITGGTGFVGSNIVKVFAEEHGAEVVVPTHSFVPPSSPHLHEPLDLTDRAAVVGFLARHQPSVVVHSAILNDYPLISLDRRAGWAHYVDATRNVVDGANQIGAKVILVSTDWVFDGTQAPADETTPPNPVNLYGTLKFASEMVVGERAVSGAVARVAGVNGVHWARADTPRRQDPGFGYFASWIVDALRGGKPFRVWEAPDINMVATTSLASESAEMMWRIAERDLTGVFHCVGGESVTRRGLAEATVAAFDLDPALLEFGPPEQSVAEIMPGARIPHDTTLDARATAAALDYDLPSLADQLAWLRAQHDEGKLK